MKFFYTHTHTKDNKLIKSVSFFDLLLDTFWTNCNFKIVFYGKGIGMPYHCIPPESL
jgi:hypothetical protein